MKNSGVLVAEFISEKINVREHNNRSAGAHHHCVALAYSLKKSIGFQIASFGFLFLVDEFISVKK